MQQQDYKGQQATLVQKASVCTSGPLRDTSPHFRQQITRHALERGAYWSIRMLADAANTGQAQDLYVTGLLQSQDLILRELDARHSQYGIVTGEIPNLFLT